ncbi:ATP synthase F1 subunit gamma [Mycoplasmoides pirum]|uniref:ATP synthase F1 subunit gamma n=1 Tax=Mycoplasmoides pirum TaxID=2122 RepID=UPI0004873D6E|nr:ATP synthase F1 subunit gamma [Mycoplasmoides pirum]
MASKQELKQKMSSILVTEKITKAMQMAATAKLHKFKSQHEKIYEFFNEYYETIGKVIANAKYYQPPKQVKENSLYILINSSLGLCGGFNNNMNRLLLEKIKPNDKLILLGKKSLGYWKLKNQGNNILLIKDLQDADINFDISYNLGQEILDLYETNEYEKVFIVYTNFVNNLKQEPKIIQVLPFDVDIFKDKIKKDTNSNKQYSAPIEFEPDVKEVIKGLTPQFMQIVLYGCLIETKLSEYASRRNAMESATKNANDLYNNYLLLYNQLRQASITQEISEIIQGSEQK